MIIIANIHNIHVNDKHVLVYVGRKTSLPKISNIHDFSSFIHDFSSLGNPFYMSSETDRDNVCISYDLWFKSNPLIYNALQNLLSLYIETFKANKILVLLCFCTPKRCHAETIKQWLDEVSKLKDYLNDTTS